MTWTLSPLPGRMLRVRGLRDRTWICAEAPTGLP